MNVLLLLKDHLSAHIPKGCQMDKAICEVGGAGPQLAPKCLCKLEDCTLPASDAVLHRWCSLEGGTELAGDPLCSQQ